MNTRIRKVFSLIPVGLVLITSGFVNSPKALAQNITIPSGKFGPGVNSGTGSDVPLVQPCDVYPNDACVVVASFKSTTNYWYNNNGSTNGIGGAAIFFYVNGVYTSTYKTNGSSNKGAITVVAPLQETVGFLGTQAYQNCTNQAYSEQSFFLTKPWNNTTGLGVLYSLGIPYSCS